MKKILGVLLFILSIDLVFSQVQAAKEFYFSASSGLSLFGPGKDIFTQMTSCGFNNTLPKGWFGGPVEHPSLSNTPLSTYDLEATYYFNANMGIALNYGLVSNISVDGYDDKGVGISGNFLFLRSKIRSVSLNYNYRSSDRILDFTIGPVVLIHDVKDVSAGVNSPENENTKFGANIGFSLKAVNKRKWFMAVKTHYRWAQKSQIGPFVSESIKFPDRDTFTSVFQSTKVSLGNLNIGVAIGVRLFKM